VYRPLNIWALFATHPIKNRKKLMMITCPETNNMVKKFKLPLMIMTRVYSTSIRRFWFDDLRWHQAVFCSLSLSLSLSLSHTHTHTRSRKQYTQIWQDFQHLTNEKLFNYIQNDPQKGPDLRPWFSQFGIKENSIYWGEFSISVINMNITDRLEKSLSTSW